MRPTTLLFSTLLAALVLAAALHAKTLAQTTGPRNPPLVISSTSGRDLFEFYCAPCHGRDGKGSGPVVAALKTRPPDLTTIARRNDGMFPTARVESFVTGGRDELIPAHGSKDMPIWGPIFQALEPGDTMNRVRVANIAGYIKSIQVQ